MVRRPPSKKSVATDAADETIDNRVALTGRAKALVFISHDSRDADLAEAFADMLADVSVGTVESFRSSDNKGTSGIEFGDKWYEAILVKLGKATDVVALLTANSLDRPWILYEAGIAAGRLDTRVVGITLGVALAKATVGPFGQFQNCTDEENSLTKLMMQLVRRNPDAAPREEAVRMQVRIFGEKVGKILNARGTQTAEPTPTEEQNTAKLFEEVKSMVRDLPERVDDRVRQASKRGPRRLRRLHPMMLEEMMFHPRLREKKDGTAAAWLVFISVLKDDCPWIYEPGLELYRALRAGRQTDIQRARHHLLAVAELTSRHPIFREFLDEGNESSFLLRHLDEVIERSLSNLHLIENEPAAEDQIDTKKA
jgi:hypothetical protein